jgi:hypothetical protein
MSGVDQDIEALWTAVFGEPPPVTATAEVMLDILVRHLPPAPPYRQLFSTADLRPSVHSPVIPVDGGAEPLSRRRG